MTDYVECNVSTRCVCLITLKKNMYIKKTTQDYMDLLEVKK